MFIKLASDCLKLLYQEIFLKKFFLGIVCHVVRPTFKICFPLPDNIKKRMVGWWNIFVISERGKMNSKIWKKYQNQLNFFIILKNTSNLEFYNRNTLKIRRYYRKLLNCKIKILVKEKKFISNREMFFFGLGHFQWVIGVRGNKKYFIFGLN